MLLGTGVMVGVFTFSFMGGTYLAGYAVAQLHHPRNLILLVGVLGGLAMVALTAISARLSDTCGRRRVILIGFALGVPWSFVVLPLLDTGSPTLYGVGITGTFAILGVSYGPMAAFIPETFGARYRYTGAGLAFNLAGILGGAVPPLIAGVLMASFGQWAIGSMMAVLVGISLVSTVLLPETVGTSLTDHSLG